MTQPAFVIGTRGSDLALYQANFIKGILSEEHNCSITLNIIKTSGDKLDKLSFDKMEGKGFFTKELEDALLSNEIDLAVHSLKDLMTTQPEGLKLGSVGYRADCREMLLIRKESKTDNGVLPIKDSGVIGTSSMRRKCQIAYHNPSLQIKDLRGNVPTRLRKLREENYDAIIIAAAGINRLELDISDFEVVLLDPDIFLPAPAQGILGIQIRDNDPDVEKVISLLGSKKAMTEALLERGLLNRFDGGCSLPLGVLSKIEDGKMTLKAILGQQDGDKWIGLKRIEITGDDVTAIVDEAFRKLTE